MSCYVLFGFISSGKQAIKKKILKVLRGNFRKSQPLCGKSKNQLLSFVCSLIAFR